MIPEEGRRIVAYESQNAPYEEKAVYGKKELVSHGKRR